MRIKPKAGLKVRHSYPVNKFLAEEGEEVENSTYWQRRLTDGDVVLVVSETTKNKNNKDSI